MRLAGTIELPDAVRAVGVALRAIHQAQPEHRPGPLRRQFVGQHFVACLAVDDRHSRRGSKGLAHGPHDDGHRLALAVWRLHEVEIQQRFIVRSMPRSVAVDGRGVNGERAAKSVGRADET